MDTEVSRDVYVDGKICRRVLMRSNGAVRSVEAREADAPANAEGGHCQLASDKGRREDAPAIPPPMAPPPPSPRTPSNRLPRS